jgi:hypothetical protein
VGTFVPVDGHRQNHGADFTAVVALLVRLEKQESDILVLVHVPHMNSDGREPDLSLAAPTSKLETGLEIAAEISRTLEIKDLGLFGE